MTEFIATSEGKLINITSVAYITTRRHPQSQMSAGNKGARVSYRAAGVPTHQLIIGFSAAGTDSNGMRPLSMMLEGDEAVDFLNQLGKLGLEIAKLLEKVTPPAAEEEKKS